MAGPAGVEPATPDLEGLINCSTQLLDRFGNVCRVDRNLSERTVKDYSEQIRRFLATIKKPPTEITADDIREYLSKFQDRSPCTKANVLKAFRVFFRDFMKMPQVIESFKFPKRIYSPKTVPTKEDLKKFFDALETDRDRAIPRQEARWS